MDIQPHKHVRSPGRFNPWLVGLALFFVCIFTVNAWMVHLGMESFPGVTTSHHYEKGLAFNSTLQQRREQEDLGVTVRVETSGMVCGREGILRLKVTDRAGTWVTGLHMSGMLYRNVREGWDQPLTLVERAAGRYEARLTPPLPGLWEVRLEADGMMGGAMERLTYHHPLTVESGGGCVDVIQ
ncbi:MAG: FixH family protein [Magnetococcales bacterium]|nr:FixH family protein [Magnetococcales bacterium]